ncbi:hypothetical protein WH47_05450 [Habropoda laboriosa]|uniref:Uncharacterized protein n=1 Tax=Habropoda laboriosa TaxID=597456 RepID=A0A0L7REV4_9HYME|nr:hypothetical protein WH47_05450 [Habropoda laboriosa]
MDNRNSSEVIDRSPRAGANSWVVCKEAMRISRSTQNTGNFFDPSSFREYLPDLNDLDGLVNRSARGIIAAGGFPWESTKQRGATIGGPENSSGGGLMNFTQIRMSCKVVYFGLFGVRLIPKLRTDSRRMAKISLGRTDGYSGLVFATRQEAQAKP